MIKKFFREHSHLKLALQQLGLFGGGWRIQVYNTTWDCGVEPIFEHYITNEDLDKLKVDFETAIMTPIINWWEDIQERRRKEKVK